MISLKKAQTVARAHAQYLALARLGDKDPVTSACWRTAEEFGITLETLSRYLRLAKQDVSMEKQPLVFDGVTQYEPSSYEPSFKPNDIIGVIGDTHEPFCHKDYLGFVTKTFEKYGVTKVVHIGDLVDNHAISRHISEPNAMGAEKEYELTLNAVSKWVERFPELTVCEGNHDSIPARQAKELGIPELYIRNMSQLFNLPYTWNIVEEIVINDVYYQHGVGNGGLYGAANLAKIMSMSSVMGHLHSCGFCHYLSNPTKLWFGLAVGCGIDIKAYAFRYAKPFKRRPILGCGIVKSPVEAYFVPMHI